MAAKMSRKWMATETIQNKTSLTWTDLLHAGTKAGMKPSNVLKV